VRRSGRDDGALVRARTGRRAADTPGPAPYAGPMTSSVADPAPTLTYARARLFLGASAVGTLTVLAALALVLGLPERWWPTEPGPWVRDAFAWSIAVAVHAAVLAPFDLFAGSLIPRAYGRTAEPLGAFLRRWARGAVLHGLVLTGVGALVMAAARTAGGWGAVAAFVVLSLALLAGQPWLAAAVAGARVRHLPPAPPTAPLGRGALAFDTPQVHVTGGAYGLPFRTAWVVPGRWASEPDRVALDAQSLRRAWIARSGARDRGVLLALARNLVPLLLVLAVWGAPTAAADVVRWALLGTVWSFVGLLVLPTPSRRAVLDADRAARAEGVDPLRLAAALERLDHDQDDEPERSAGVETIFHPIPGLRRRTALLASVVPPTAAGTSTWHAARVALYTSWAGGGFLGRAVHCNLGRPEVWVFLPSD
jgi:hypothetical protein